MRFVCRQHERGSRCAKEPAKQLSEFIDETHGEAVVVAGDFNIRLMGDVFAKCWWDSPYLRKRRKGLSNAPRHAR